MRITLTLRLDLQRKRDQPEPDQGNEYVPAAQVERAEPQRVGFTIDPPTRLEPDDQR